MPQGARKCICAWKPKSWPCRLSKVHQLKSGRWGTPQGHSVGASGPQVASGGVSGEGCSWEELLCSWDPIFLAQWSHKVPLARGAIPEISSCCHSRLQLLGHRKHHKKWGQGLPLVKGSGSDSVLQWEGREAQERGDKSFLCV